MFLTTHKVVNDWTGGRAGVALPMRDQGEVGNAFVVYLDADKSEKRMLRHIID